MPAFASAVRLVVPPELAVALLRDLIASSLSFARAVDNLNPIDFCDRARVVEALCAKNTVAPMAARGLLKELRGRCPGFRELLNYVDPVTLRINDAGGFVNTAGVQSVRPEVVAKRLRPANACPLLRQRCEDEKPQATVGHSTYRAWHNHLWWPGSDVPLQIARRRLVFHRRNAVLKVGVYQPCTMRQKIRDSG